MLNTDQISKIIYTALETLNDEMGPEEQIPMVPETILFGVDSKIDSLALVSVVVDVETELNADHGLEISLTDDRAMTREISPFNTVATLRDYIFELVQEQA